MIWWFVKRALLGSIWGAALIFIAKYLVSVGGGEPDYAFAPYLIAATQPDGMTLIVVGCIVLSIITGAFKAGKKG